VTELVGGETLSPEYRPGLDKVTPSQSRVSDLETPQRKQDNVNDLLYTSLVYLKHLSVHITDQ